jgi:hypothetical protein
MRRPLTFVALAAALPLLLSALPARAAVPKMTFAEEFGATS